jgi:hypothetical protein
MNLAELAEKQSTEPRHIVVYGAPKSGKTELVGGLAKDFKLWWISLDGGHKTLLRKDSAAYPYLKNIEVFYIRDSQLYPMAVESVLKILRAPGRNVEICEKHGKVACPLCSKDGSPIGKLPLADFGPKDILVIDSYSQLMASVINNMLKDDLLKDNFDGKSTWDDYRKQGSISDRFGSTIQVAPYNVVIITHEVLTEMEDGTKKIAPLGGTRNKSADFSMFFDDVVYCEIVNGEYKAYSSGEKKTRIVVGSRTGKKLQDSAGKQLGLGELFK